MSDIKQIQEDANDMAGYALILGAFAYALEADKAVTHDQFCRIVQGHAESLVRLLAAKNTKYAPGDDALESFRYDGARQIVSRLHEKLCRLKGAVAVAEEQPAVVGEEGKDG